MTESGWLKQSEAADYLEITPSDLTRLRESGKGPVLYKKGVLVRYKQEDLDEWVEHEFSSLGAPDESWDRVEPAAAESAPEGDIFGPEKSLAPDPPAAAPVASGINIRDPELLKGMPADRIAGVDFAPSRLLNKRGESLSESPLALKGETRTVPSGGSG